MGTVDFTTGPVPNCATTGLVGVQWVKAEEGPWEFALNIVSNADHPSVPVTAAMSTNPAAVGTRPYSAVAAQKLRYKTAHPAPDSHADRTP